MIDLDLVPPAPAAGTGRPGLAPRTRRPAVVAALVLAVLLTLAGAAPAAPGLSLLLRVGGDRAVVSYAPTPTAVFTVVPGSRPDSRSELRRYALSGDSPEWAVHAPPGVHGLMLAEAAHVVVALSGSRPDASYFDADTGRILWRGPFDPDGAMTDTGLLSVVRDRTDGDAVPGGRAELRMVDLRTGRVSWSREIPSTANVSTGEPAVGPPTRTVVVTAAGRATVLDLADGAVLGRADLRLRLQTEVGDGSGDLTEIIALDNRLYVVRRVAGVTSISAYAGDDLRLRWQVTGQPYGVLSACGPVICLDTGNAIVALDNRDGVQRWRDNTRSTALALDASDTRAPLLATTNGGELEVLDPATGRVRQRLGDGWVVDGLVLRSDPRAPDRTWVTAADAGGTFRGLGRIDSEPPDGCASAGRHLACLTASGIMSVWRLPGRAPGESR